jgi:hypothetical protein
MRARESVLEELPAISDRGGVGEASERSKATGGYVTLGLHR